jgi:hypothetical protein
MNNGRHKRTSDMGKTLLLLLLVLGALYFVSKAISDCAAVGGVLVNNISGMPECVQPVSK